MRIVSPIGRKGEDIAATYLKGKGYTILERNFRKKYAEIDIIAVGQNKLIFIEVKTRTSEEFGSPLEAITPWKMRPLTKAAEYYSMIHPELPNELRIDAIGIILTSDWQIKSLEHKENISGF